MVVGAECPGALETRLARMVDASEISQVERTYLQTWSSAVILRPNTVMMEYNAWYFASGEGQWTAATDA